MPRQSDVPLHAVIRSELLAEIDSGHFAPGDQIPTEPELIAQFQVSRTTVRRALRDLEMTGRITRQPGRGSFVREPRLEPRLDRLTGFVEDMSALGLSASARVISVEEIRARGDVAENLKVRPGVTIVHIQRVRLADGSPISFDDSYFRANIGRQIAAENLEIDPFYSILESKYRLPLSEADYVVAASLADTRVAELLRTQPGAPILHLERTSYLVSDPNPILYEHLYYRGDLLRYRLNLKRQNRLDGDQPPIPQPTVDQSDALNQSDGTSLPRKADRTRPDKRRSKT